MFPVNYLVQFVALFLAIMPATEQPLSGVSGQDFLVNSHSKGPLNSDKSRLNLSSILRSSGDRFSARLEEFVPVCVPVFWWRSIHRLIWARYICCFHSGVRIHTIRARYKVANNISTQIGGLRFFTGCSGFLWRGWVDFVKRLSH